MSQQQEPPSPAYYSLDISSNELQPEYDTGLDNTYASSDFYLSHADGEGEIDAFYGCDPPNQNIAGDQRNVAPAQDRRQRRRPRPKPSASNTQTQLPYKPIAPKSAQDKSSDLPEYGTDYANLAPYGENLEYGGHAGSQDFTQNYGGSYAEPSSSHSQLPEMIRRGWKECTNCNEWKPSNEFISAPTSGSRATRQCSHCREICRKFYYKQKQKRASAGGSS
ncbi:hypothetical protein DL766_004470 [Monosporascus sp. MC13-8B]|uniref:GATA-type domain-containing protein n=1 Tax=Monosporascus cannonballus TaxID=155416 RepID=A0ABY0H2H7_9PEZI|nr:hypothetical protein DL762_006303 [Monosporascus cannonballus]RYP01395.1 hypothetical protein DL763_000205 [Monosporascus cannonballus]RYP31287.1 hypothetical protein DL766_004470 [Monosporascus sp. MC13-8B]